MSVELTIKAIETIARSMSDASELERFNYYATVKVLTDELLDYAQSHNLPHAYISEKLVELLEAFRRLADLDPVEKRRYTQELTAALSAIKKLCSPLCFSVERKKA